MKPKPKRQQPKPKRIGLGMKVYPKGSKPKPPLFGTSVGSTGLSGAGNRGARGSGSPSHGSGGSSGDILTNPLTGGPIVTPGGALAAAGIETLRAIFGMPDRGSTPSPTDTASPQQSTGGTDMSSFDQLTEAPSTDAEHLENVNGLADDVKEMSERLTEYIQMCQDKGMDSEALDSGQRAAEALSEAADAIGNMGQDFENSYSGVRETAASGKQIIGDNGPVDFWTGDGGR